MSEIDYKGAKFVDEPKFSGSVMAPGVPYSGAAESARAVGQGITFGFLDELEAALRTGAISGPEYERQRNLLRDQQDQFGLDMPITKTGLEIGGSLIAPFGPLNKWLD
jgi:hypothetical protein